MPSDTPATVPVLAVHAHPDDEASGTSGSMALTSRAGGRVVVAYATGGEHGAATEIDLGLYARLGAAARAACAGLRGRATCEHRG